MSPDLSPVLALLALTLLLWFTLQLLVDQGYRQLRPRLQQLTAARRIGINFWLCAMPLLTTVLAISAVLGPWPGALLLESHCHLSSHCTAHSPTGLGMDAASMLMLIAGLLLLRATVLGIRFHHAHKQLSSFSRQTHSEAYEQLDCSPALALTSGLLRPRVFLSTGLIAQLSTTELRAVLAHEQAHQRHRDNLRHFLAQLLTAPAFARQLRADLHQAIEQRADQQAAHCCGGPEAMAHILIRLQRLALASPPLLHSGMGGADFTQRIHALLQASAPPASARWWPAALITAIVLLAGVFSSPVHHALETYTALLY